MLVVNAASTAAFLSSGTCWSAVPAPVSTPVAVNTSVVWSGPATDRSTAMLTLSSKPAAFGVPVNTSPLLLEMPDSVVPPVASLVSLRRRLDQQVGDAHEPADVGGVDDDAALHLADRQLGVGLDQPRAFGRSIECSVASQRGLARRRGDRRHSPGSPPRRNAGRVACGMNGKPRMPPTGRSPGPLRVRTLLARRYSA